MKLCLCDYTLCLEYYCKRIVYWSVKVLSNSNYHQILGKILSQKILQLLNVKNTPMSISHQYFDVQFRIGHYH